MKHKHPLAKAAAMAASSPKLAARESGLTKAQCRAIRDLQAARRNSRSFVDPLIKASQTRRWRTASMLAQEEKAAEARAAQLEEVRRRRAAAIERADATRKSLQAAARVARKMGFQVRPSKDRRGRISSYYCESDARRLRISDHEIPWTETREMQSHTLGHGGYAGYGGPELIVDQPRSRTWLRRAITLTAAGRVVP